MPYVEVAGAAGGTDLDVREQDSEFTLLPFGGAGASYFFADRAAIYAGYRFQHISNAGPNPVNGRNWHDPYYEPLWSELEALDVPLSFHEGLGAYLPQVGDRFARNVMLRHTVCHPGE